MIKYLIIISWCFKLWHSKFKCDRKFFEFKENADVIVTNRMADELLGLEDNIFTRDLFGYN